MGGGLRRHSTKDNIKRELRAPMHLRNKKLIENDIVIGPLYGELRVKSTYT